MDYEIEERKAEIQVIFRSVSNKGQMYIFDHGPKRKQNLSLAIHL